MNLHLNLISVLISTIFIRISESITCYQCRSDRTNICENLDDPRLVARIPQPECDHLQAWPTFACIKTVQYTGGFNAVRMEPLHFSLTRTSVISFQLLLV